MLGGQGAPAFEKGIALAKPGYATRLVPSLQTWQSCGPYQSYVASHLPKVHVDCFKSNPQTTQGEARAIEAFAKDYHWTRIIVVVPTTQASPARLRIGRCCSGRVLESAFSAQGTGQWLEQFAYEVEWDLQGRGVAAELLRDRLVRRLPRPARHVVQSPGTRITSHAIATFLRRLLVGARCTLLTGAPAGGSG